MAEVTGPTVQLIFNPTAGGHRPSRVAELRAGFERQGARVIASECGPGLEIEIHAEASYVCVIGGDGTVRHVAHALQTCGRPLPLGLYPGGTVNLLHREIGSPIKPYDHARHMLREGGASPHFAAAVNDTIFLACASAGPDSRAVAALSPRLKRWIGKAAYLVAFVTVLAKWPRQPITLRHEGGTHSCEAFYVAKGRYFAGSWSFAPDARMKEPLLHVVALQTARRRDFARFAWALLRGRRPETLPGIFAFTCTALTAEAAEPIPVQADGDIVTSLPVHIQVRPDPISFC